MIDPNQAETIESALRRGGHMHAFSSGGGLRVIRIEKPRHGKLWAYGEHPHVREAFRILADDFKAGGRPYAEVYGKAEPHYLTGDPKPDSELDAWLRKGSTFDAFAKDGEIVFELRGLEMHETPQETVERACAGETIRWTDDRGVTWEATPGRFPNGEACCSIRDVERPVGMNSHRASMWDAVRRGVASTLEKAIALALVAKREEIVPTRRSA